MLLMKPDITKSIIPLKEQHIRRFSKGHDVIPNQKRSSYVFLITIIGVCGLHFLLN